MNPELVVQKVRVSHLVCDVLDLTGLPRGE